MKYKDGVFMSSGLAEDIAKALTEKATQRGLEDAVRGWKAVLVHRGLWSLWDEECFKSIADIIRSAEKEKP